jgi:hypothetical protein
MFNDADIDDDSDELTYDDIRLYRVKNPVLFFKSVCAVAIGMTILYLKYQLSNCQSA